MKNLNPLLANLKSAALILFLAGFILASGLIAIKTLLLTEMSIETSVRPSVNASSDDSGVKVNSDDQRVNSGDRTVTSGRPSVTVWVNTTSGVYHCPNTRWYGNTKSGKYMTQEEAQSKGYRPAHGNVCA